MLKYKETKILTHFSALVVAFTALTLLLPKPTIDNRSDFLQKILGVSRDSSFKNLSAAPEIINTISPPALKSRAAFAIDLKSGSILFAQNFDEALPIASLTKLMTAIVVVKQNQNLTRNVEIKRNTTQVIGTNMGLVSGEKISLLDLLQGMLIPSSNDAALALAAAVAGSEEDFVRFMNLEAKNLSLASTHFGNSAGYDGVDNFSTAHDLSVLAKEFLKHPVLVSIVATKEATIHSVDKKYEHKITTTNKLMLEDSNIKGIKTGYTTQALGNLLILSSQNNQEIITIVLGSENREEDTRKLLNWIFTVYKW